MAVTVFEKYGGFGSVSKVVLEFYDRVANSQVLSPNFANSDMRTLVDHQTKFIAQVMGGPVAYADETLRRVHSHLAIDERAFEAMHDLLEETLDDFDFKPQDIEAVMSEIRRRRDLIVTK